MEWFSGSIPQAIYSSKVNDAVFVVFISDSSEAASSTEEILGNSSPDLKKHLVAVKVDSNSEEAKQFAQIYPVVVIPSLYFINPDTGVPVEILGGAVTADMLEKKMPNVIKHGKVKSSGDNVVVVTTTTAASMEAEAAAATATETGAAAASTSAAAVDMDTPGTSQSDESSRPQTLAERVAKVKQLADQKARQREEELKQKELDDEIQRRQMGKDMRRVKREQQEKEMKELAAERKKDKEIDRLARERVKAQIAADRSERETRAALLRGEAAPPAAGEAPTAATSAPPVAPSSSSSNTCRLKLRLPDGSSTLAQFPASTVLSEVHQHVRDHVTLPFPRFKLASSLQQRPFTQDDMATSLQQLGLAPSAILLIMPTGSTTAGTVAASSGLWSSLLWLLLLPYNTVVDFFRSFLSRGSPAQQGGDGAASGDGSTGSRTPDAVRRRPNRPKTAYGTREQARSRREGNIHRLGNEDDSDENNTWNGNSTQQM